MHSFGPPLHLAGFAWTTCGKILKMPDQKNLFAGNVTCKECLQSVKEITESKPKSLAQEASLE